MHHLPVFKSLSMLVGLVCGLKNEGVKICARTPRNRAGSPNRHIRIRMGIIVLALLNLPSVGVREIQEGGGSRNSVPPVTELNGFVAAVPGLVGTIEKADAVPVT